MSIMKQAIILLALMGVMTNAHAQSNLLWSEDFVTQAGGGSLESPVIQAIGDTLRVFGRENTPDGQRLAMVNYDLLGDTISTRTYGSDSVANNIIAEYAFDASNHVYVLHQEQLGFYKKKIVLQKYALNGELLWVRQIQDPADTSYAPLSLDLVNDTCLLVTAYKEYDYPGPGDDILFTETFAYAYAYHTSGNTLWQRAFDPDTEIGSFLSLPALQIKATVVQGDGVLLLGFAGITRKLLRIDINNILTINTDIVTPIGTSLQLTPDNKLLTTTNARYIISKVDTTGALSWSQSYGTNLPSNVSGDRIRATQQDSMGNIYVTGQHYGPDYGTPAHTDADILTLKYDSSGQLLWENRYVFGVDNMDIGNTIFLQGGQMYVGGQSNRLGRGTDFDYVVLKMDSATGESTGLYRYDGPDSGNDVVTSLHVFDNGHVALTGTSIINGQPGWTTQLLSDVILSLPATGFANHVQVYPNPVSPGAMLTIAGTGFTSYRIVSMLGQTVQHGELAHYALNHIRLSSLPTGLYLVQMQGADFDTTRKLMVK